MSIKIKSRQEESAKQWDIQTNQTDTRHFTKFNLKQGPGKKQTCRIHYFPRLRGLTHHWWNDCLQKDEPVHYHGQSRSQWENDNSIWHDADGDNELTERLSEPLPKGFILKLLLVRLAEVKICHLKEKGSLCFLCGISFVFFVAL